MITPNPAITGVPSLCILIPSNILQSHQKPGGFALVPIHRVERKLVHDQESVKNHILRGVMKPDESEIPFSNNVENKFSLVSFRGLLGVEHCPRKGL